MFFDHLFMRALLALFGVLFAVACTKQNPRSCADGTCTDPAFPFCDVDGTVDGAPNTCLAVDCTAGVFEACRGDQAITCNGFGNDFDVTECPLGCSSGSNGCNQCTSEAQCSNPSPVCDLDTSSCRKCVADDECTSRVCDLDSGTCVDQGSILYVAPNGPGLCTLTQPCLIADAILRSRSTLPPPIIRILPGTYSVPIDVRQTPTGPLSVVATDAIVLPSDGSPAITVRDGATVSIRGGKFEQVLVASCGTATGMPSALSIRNASFFALGNATMMDLVRCTLALEAVDIELNGEEVIASLGDDVELRGDRLCVRGNNSHHIGAFGKHVTVQLTNSLLEDVSIDVKTTDTTAPGSSFTFAEDTFVYRFPASQGCDVASPNRIVRYENSILAPLTMFDAVSGTACSFQNTLLSHQASPPAGTSVVDPHFVDPTTRDFHLTGTSPAIDAALPSMFGLDSTVDLDGVSRPQGIKSDIGAYERRP